MVLGIIPSRNLPFRRRFDAPSMNMAVSRLRQRAIDGSFLSWVARAPDAMIRVLLATVIVATGSPQ